ncbi:unnamed protein product [Arabidopsis lyrata]|uniref:C2 domain-containing protein n=1 Tax=Arabidopsis lyrata subsp. lyrata TaxID=81972 RepID=D7MT73_ARALL|nr:uncharacterized protein LOC9301012 [Arabidopsis lyrata subsp. lyrata]EFH42906.1 hypothetical protein ARALYDRAFT_332722 [Arabidopsis lyrata subsp. lyrata]CAH8280855.1 unnamed protein product [Arabidopsis lyrata]|eukprot:XP_002866647.1 uncharacterized protein LOC9301012 [Arabidopsis lyrata subsp. lyrata]
MGVMEKKLRSLKCEVRIVEARNVEIKSQASTLFVRFYLSAGHKRKIEVNTREISSKSDQLMWDQSFGLECQGDEAALQELKQQRVVFELRRKKTPSFLRKSSRSEVVGRGEVSWESVFESPGMEIERFVVMGESKNQVSGDEKPMLLKIALKVQALEEMEKILIKKDKKTEKLCCVCSSRDCGSCNCLDYEAFALACALDCI